MSWKSNIPRLPKHDPQETDCMMCEITFTPKYYHNDQYGLGSQWVDEWCENCMKITMAGARVYFHRPNNVVPLIRKGENEKPN